MTEPAARHLFDGITRHVELLSGVDMYDLGFRSARGETRAQAGVELHRYRSHEFALAVLCGSILQLADIGLALCSKNSSVPESCKEFTPTGAMARFCVGREVHGLPIGAYVHAARNQFAHWGDEVKFDSAQKWPAGFDRFTQGVFDRLLDVHYDDPFADLVYELGNHFYGGTPIRAADVVLSVLRWSDYDKYVSDMTAMIMSEDSAE